MIQYENPLLLGLLKRMRTEDIEKMEMEELDRINKIKIEEMLRFGKMIIEEIKRFEKIKQEMMEKLKLIKLLIINKFINSRYIRFKEKEERIKYLKDMIAKTESWKTTELERLEKIKKEKSAQLKKMEMEEIDRHKNLIDSEIWKLQNVLKLQHLIFLGAGPPKGYNRYLNESKIKIIFEEVECKNNEQIKPIIIECSLKDKISTIIEKYKEKSNYLFQDRKFIFENEELVPDMTVENAKLKNNCIIKVINI